MISTCTTSESPLVLDKYGKCDWDELPDWVQEAAMDLGYTQKHWDRDKEPDTCGEYWQDLSDFQRKAAEKLGYQQDTWNKEGKRSGSTVLDQYEDFNWKELPSWVKKAAKVLGYNKELWNHFDSPEPEICKMDWEDLTDCQREAALELGYTETKWDEEDTEEMRVCPKLEDVHKHLKWTIYCIQLYTETPDYQFRVNELTGLSMHTNRVLDAEEVIIRSPVGPKVHKKLFQVKKSGVLSEERKGFAERFLEWQETYQSINRIGAQNGNITVKLEDFSNPPITSKEYRTMPCDDHLVYDLEIFEHEVVICEFIPPPSNSNYELPPARRFEILHYDEGLVGLDGEEGYDPSVMKRPPTLCGMEERSLELPGHFTNHASGETSTAFDFMSGKISKDFSPGHEDNFPEWLSKEFAALKRLDGDKGTVALKTRRALEPGTEITTDYSRWHWSNGDYHHGASRKTPIGYFLGDDTTDRWDWDELSPKLQRAAEILGFNEDSWDDEETPASFGKSWKNLSLQEQEAAVNLTGHNEESWNREKGFASESSACSSRVGVIDKLEWAALSEEQRKAATILGHNEITWNEGDHAKLLGEELYWYNLRPEHRDALVALGETEVTWTEDEDEKDASEPWFYCLCGDTHCHSSKERGGFRGVEYFSVEEQRKLAPLCEPWVQQSIAWRMYQIKPKKNLARRLSGIKRNCCD